jgi:hypothetical protein
MLSRRGINEAVSEEYATNAKAMPTNPIRTNVDKQPTSNRGMIDGLTTCLRRRLLIGYELLSTA